MHDFFHRQVGGEGEPQFLAKLLRADPEIAVRTREQIFLQPGFVIFESLGGFFLERGQSFLHLRHFVEQRAQTFAHERNGALGLLDRGLGVNARGMLQVRFCLSDHARHRFHPLAQIGDTLFRRIEIAGHNHVKTIRQALHVKERVPIRLFQFLEVENVDTVCAAQLRSIVKADQLIAELLRARQQPTAIFGRIIGQLIIKTMVAQFGGGFRRSRQLPYNVIAGDFFKLLIPRSCVRREDRQ